MAVLHWLKGNWIGAVGGLIALAVAAFLIDAGRDEQRLY